MGGYWQMPDRSRQTQVITFDGGINVGAPPVSIAENQSSDERGWDLTHYYPALHTRRAKQRVGSGGASGTPRLLTDFNGVLIRASGGTLQQLNGSSWSNIATGLANTDWDYTHFEVDGNPAIILTNGTDPVKYWNGSSLNNLHSNAPRGKYITNDTIRVWIAKEDILHYSAFLDAQDWTTPKNSGSVQYYTPRGGDITALSRYADRIVVFKENSMAELHGTNYFEFRLMDISNDIGCLNHKTVQEVQGLLYWLGPGPDVYVYTGGRPKSIGGPLRQYLNQVTDPSRCFGGSDGFNYFLGLDLGHDFILLVYSPKHHIWRVFDTISPYRLSHFMSGRCLMMEPGGVFEFVEGFGDEDPSEFSAEYVTKPLDGGFPEAQKEYYEAHLQGFLMPGSYVEVYISRDDEPWGEFELIDRVEASDSYTSQSHGFMIPLDRLPLAHWVRFKLRAVGLVQLYQMQLYFDVLPVQQGTWSGVKPPSPE